jgi:osmotically-inducible protein OsmY
MSTPNKLYALSLALILATGLPGCALFGKCGYSGCPGDAEITSEVYELLAEHPALGAPGELRVHTIDRVVYLNGLVNTEFDSRIAEATAYQAAHVKLVVNSLGVRSNSR